MNILFLYGGTINPERGGVQRVTAVLSDEFSARGNGVFYLSLPHGTDEKISPRQFFLPNENYKSPENRSFFQNFLSEKKIDVVINQGGNGKDGSRFAYIAKERGVPVISVCHCGLIDSARNYRAIHETAWKRRGLGWLLPATDFRIVKKFLLWAYKKKYEKHYHELCEKSDRVVLLSESFKSEMAFYFDGKNCPENVVSITNPCSFPPPETPVKPANKRKELLFCARIDFSQKRVDLMLKIWQRLFRAFPEWELTVVGDGVALSETKALAKRMKLERVNFEGFQDPRPYYARAAIFCMTSAWETFGLVLVEAMNYGCVPVAFNSYASVTDIISDGENGILVPAMDYEKYAGKLAELMSSQSLREQLFRAGTESSQNFSAQRITDKWLRLFEEIFAKKQ